MEDGVLLFLGFDRVRWERRKAELRTRWEAERRAPTQTVTTGAAVERTDAQYWRDKQFSALRKKYMQEAEEARVRYGPCDEILKSLLNQLTRLHEYHFNHH